MRTDIDESIRARIIPDGKLPTADQNRLTLFNRTITDFNEFDRLIEDATDHMGLPPAVKDGKRATASDTRKAKAFSRNVLSIEISGPDRLPLTVVDLPGLIHAETAVQTTEDKNLIHSLVETYLMEERTIVLAVVPATNDLVNNAIFDKCRKVDPKFARTLGIITKMDKLPAGSKAEKTWLNNAQNGAIALQLGWYLLKNRSDEEGDLSFAERSKSEAEFFSGESYKVIPDTNKGIASLRSRIADLIYEDGKQRLPKIREEAQRKLSEVNASLQRLGDERSNVAEQKGLLMTIGVDFHNIVSNAVEGHWEHDFFGPNTDVELDDGRFLRAAATGLQEQFSRQMLKYGNKYIIPQMGEYAGTNFTIAQGLSSVKPFESVKNLQRQVTREQAVKWASDIHTKTRGRDIPENFDSSLVTRLFHEQSENWDKIAMEHIGKVEQLCTDLVIAAIKYVCPAELANNLFDRVEGILERRFNAAHSELNKLLEDCKAPISIYDAAHASDVQAMIDRKLQAQLDDRQRQLEAHHFNRTLPGLDIPKQTGNMNTASKALDQLITLYAHQRDTFTANMIHQVIERHLLKGLANETFSPTIVHGLSDQEVMDLAKEPVEVTTERNGLKHRKDILEKTRKAFLKVLNPRTVAVEGMDGETEGSDDGPKRLRRRMI
ncbi:unnamed protein product [Zymoseptoria tritici ST99CH_1E4]|uniref:GED domain-containing protein n=1 Tax=Zymoseptoria tritici ST99CH_1E4 TaxID=1276532 RepID=A0A2H1H4U2_ZYMTR|nr:unnamed protein product [Zymoseptoria tritici ST99CH_1E4]